jgi:competence ComEA-like helix-hairpin-helix protein
MKKSDFHLSASNQPVLTVWLLTLFAFFISLILTHGFQHRLSSGPGLHLLKKGASKDLPTQKLTLNINTASLEELIQLDGVGPVLGNRIVEYRKQKGNFRSERDLLNVKGLGPKKVNKFREKVKY